MMLVLIKFNGSLQCLTLLVEGCYTQYRVQVALLISFPYVTGRLSRIPEDVTQRKRTEDG